jgi:hypothetical protein
MATYRIGDTIVKSANATASWDEDTRWDGSNNISCATGSQWSHERLYRSRKGRYWLESWSDWQGTTPHAEWLSFHEAACWLMANGHDLPDDLAEYDDEVCE